MHVIRTKKERRYEHIKAMYENKLNDMYFKFSIDGDIDVDLPIGGYYDFSGGYIESVEYLLSEWRDAFKELEQEVSQHVGKTSTWNFNIVVSHNDGHEHNYGTNIECYGYDYNEKDRESANDYLLEDVVDDHMLYNS
tara:strand:+ start:9264 stop:9674 length:411 start_codon:yes stop_codon:yes gene_type:complete